MAKHVVFAFALLGAAAPALAGQAATAQSAVAPAAVADAAMQGDLAAVKAAVAAKGDVNAAQGDGTTALHWAVYRGNLEMTQFLLQQGASVAATTRLGALTPLMMAAKNGDLPIIKALLDAKADATSANANGTTVPMLAASSGQADAVKLLVDRGADVNAKEKTHGQTALMFAAAQGRVEVIKALVAAKADLDAQTIVSEIVPLSDRYKKETGGKGMRGITSEGGRSDIRSMGGMTALLLAAREGHLEAVRALAEGGANLDKQNGSDGMSPMTLAVVNGHYDIAKLLLERGANPKLLGKNGIGPLYATVDARWPERTWYPPAQVVEEKTTHLELLQLLLAKGAEPNARMTIKPWYRTFHGDWANPTGATAFWLAAKANDVDAMRVLVAGGANPSIANNGGVTPLQVATGFGLEPQVTNFKPSARLAAVRYLVEELNADVNARDGQGYTPLHGAGLTANHDVILYLVAMGADVTARAKNVFGGEGEADKDAKGDSGDTVADMANGPRAHNMQFPETVALLEGLGSKNSDNCRYATCVIKTLPGKPATKTRQ